MIPVTFSLSDWNLTSKVLLLRMEFCLVTNMTLCLFSVFCSLFLSLRLYNLLILFCSPLSLPLSVLHFLAFLLLLHCRILLSLLLCPLVSPLASPWLSHVLFQSTGAQGGNEIWRPSLNGHAHILCNYLGLRTRAGLSIYKSVPLAGPSRLLKPYPADASW